MTAHEPVVALSAIQSGVGALTIAATVPDELTGLHLLCAYQLADGESGVLDQADGRCTAPGSGARPVMTARAERDRAFVVDLMQVRALRRAVVLAAVPGTGLVAWAGALSLTTVGGARVSMSLERPAASGVQVASSIHQVDGRLVVRAEADLVAGSLRDACTQYGFTDLAWVDPWTPLV